MLSESDAGCSVVLVLVGPGSGSCCCDGSSCLHCASRASLSLILMFCTWLFRFACDAALKKPPQKMVAGLHATLTVELRGLPGDVGSLSILVLADAWSSERYVKNIIVFSSPLLKADPYAGPLPHYPKFAARIIPVFYIFCDADPAFLYLWQFLNVLTVPKVFFNRDPQDV